MQVDTSKTPIHQNNYANSNPYLPLYAAQPDNISPLVKLDFNCYLYNKFLN